MTSLLHLLRRAVELSVTIAPSSDGQRVEVRPREHPIPPDLIEHLKPHKITMLRLLDRTALERAFRLPPGPLPPGMTVLFGCYLLERDAFAPDESDHYQRLVDHELRLGCPGWYAEIEAIEQTLKQRIGRTDQAGPATRTEGAP